MRGPHVYLDSSEAQGVFPGICGYPPECQKPFSVCLLQGGSGLTPPLIETKGDTIYSAGVGRSQAGHLFLY